MTDLGTRFHMHSSNGSSIIATNPKLNTGLVRSPCYVTFNKIKHAYDVM